MRRTALVLICLAAPAAADVTPADVWADWQSTAAAYGETVTAGSVEDSGDRLVLRDVRSVWVAAPGVEVKAALDAVTMTRDGGIVRIELPATMPIAADGPDGTASGTVSFDGPALQAEGDPDAITYRYEFARVTLAMTASGRDAEGPESSAQIDGTMDAMSGVYANLPGSPDTPAEIAIAAREGTLRVTETTEGLTSTSDSSVSGLSAAATLVPVEGRSPAMAVEARLTTGPSRQHTETTTPNGPVTATVTSEGSETGLALTPDRLTLEAAGQASALALDLGPMADLPGLNFTLGDSSVFLDMPLDLMTSGPQPFGFRLDLGPVKADRAVWASLDPGENIDRSPGSLSLALSGTVAAPQPGTPFAAQTTVIPQAISLDGLALAFGGATLDASGAATFTPAPPIGAPMPEGKVEARMEGGQGLLKALTSAGLLPQQQAMAAQMMLGMVARPDGNDAMVSEVEFGPGERLVVNGLQLR